MILTCILQTDNIVERTMLDTNVQCIVGGWVSFGIANAEWFSDMCNYWLWLSRRSLCVPDGASRELWASTSTTIWRHVAERYSTITACPLTLLYIVPSLLYIALHCVNMLWIRLIEWSLLLCFTLLIYQQFLPTWLNRTYSEINTSYVILSKYN